jgi:thioredoxin-dependent peroxiredoxin
MRKWMDARHARGYDGCMMPVETSGPNVGDVAPDFTLQASDGKTYKLSDFQGQAGRRRGLVPEGVHAGLHDRVQVARRERALDRKYDVTYFMASVDPIEDNTRFAAEQNADFPLLSDPTKEVATAYGVLSERGFASRWTFYIDKDGRVAAIDKAVKPATSAEDMAAKLGELGVATR